MYTHAAAEAEARRLRTRIDSIEHQIEQLTDEEYERSSLPRTLDRLERELDALSAIDADPAAWGLGWAGDL